MSDQASTSIDKDGDSSLPTLHSMRCFLQPPAISPMLSSTPLQPPPDPPPATSTVQNVYAPAPTNSATTSNVTFEDILAKQNDILREQQKYYDRLGEILHRVTLNQESLLTSKMFL